MAAALSADAVKLAVADLPGWKHEDHALVKHFKFGSFKEALSFIVRLGLHAEEMGHHPDLHNVYNKVTIRLSTHDADDKVTQKDVDLARCIEGFSWVN